MAKVKQAKFLAGATSYQALPEDETPEVALIGRSNVGKSTLINRLTGQNKLARTSATPGRTQQINIFGIELTTGARKPLRLRLADLPGYGYAKFSKEKRADMNELTYQYLTARPNLKLVCLLNDIRRLPESDELELRDIIFAAGKNLLVVITKIDKATQSERISQMRAIATAYGLIESDFAITGIKDNGDKIWQHIVSEITATSSD